MRYVLWVGAERLGEVDQFSIRHGDVSSASAPLEEHQSGSWLGRWLTHSACLPAHRSSSRPPHTIPPFTPHTPDTHAKFRVCKRTRSILTVINSDIIWCNKLQHCSSRLQKKKHEGSFLFDETASTSVSSHRLSELSLISEWRTNVRRFLKNYFLTINICDLSKSRNKKEKSVF